MLKQKLYPNNYLILIYALSLCIFFIFAFLPLSVSAKEWCPVCKGEVGKELCLNGQCQTSCYPDGISCGTGEGHCANGSCDPACCSYQELQPGQTCTNDATSGDPIDDGGGKSVICLDPGHVTAPGMDNIQTGGVSENDNAFNVAVAVKKKLVKAGYKVVMTKDSADARKTPDGRPLMKPGQGGGCDGAEGLRNRAKYCKAEGANYMLSLHSDETGESPYIIAPPRPTSGCNPNTTAEYYNKNLSYAKKFQAKMAAVLSVSHPANPNTVVIEGNPYTNCNKSHPKCWQLNVTAGAINEELDKGLFEMTPDPLWYKNNIDLTSTAIAEGIGAAIPKDLGGGSCAQMGQKVIEAARTQMSKTYLWGGCHVEPSNFPNGCSNYDCTGLTGWAWWKGSGGKVNFHGATITGGQYQNSNVTYVKPGRDVAEGAQPGDIIGWSGTSSWQASYHGALYSGNNKLIEAYSTGSPSRETSIIGRRPLYFLRPKACK